MSKKKANQIPAETVMPAQATIDALALNTDTNIAELSTFCEALRDQLAAEVDSVIANCGGTLEQCYNAVRNRIDQRLIDLTDESVNCRDSLRSQLYVRMDEYFITTGYVLPGALTEPLQGQQQQFNEPTEQKCYYGFCWELPVNTQHYTLSGCDAVTGQAKDVDFWVLPDSSMQLIGRDGTLSATPYRFYSFNPDNDSIRQYFGLAPIDPLTGQYNCTATNGGTTNGGTPTPDTPVPGMPDSTTLEGGSCNDSALRQSCEAAGGRWSQGRCYFTPPVYPGDAINGQGSNRPCAGSVVIVRDNYGSSCAATCLVDPNDSSKVIVQLSGDAKLQCGPCPSGTFLIRDRRVNVTDNSCEATCVADESTPTRTVLLLPNGAELFCGPCGKPEDNPVNIETLQAYRFQQRQLPWFRDAVAWEGQHLIDFVNSATLKDYLDLTDRDLYDYLTGRK